MIENDADINLKNSESNTVLHIAASAGEYEKYHNMLIVPTNINLYCLGHGNIVDELLKNGADINVQNIHGETPLHQAVRNGSTIYMFKIDRKISNYMFIRLGREDVAEKLFKINVNVNLKNNDGFTVLHLAVADGREKLVEGLIERSSDVNLQNMNGDTALNIAVEKGI